MPWNDTILRAYARGNVIIGPVTVDFIVVLHTKLPDFDIYYRALVIRFEISLNITVTVDPRISGPQLSEGSDYPDYIYKRLRHLKLCHRLMY